MITYSTAILSDLPGIVKLLSENQLPTEDVHKHLENFIVAKSDGEVVGSIGIERYNEDGLLRSLAVSEKLRNQSIGKELYSKLLSYSKQRNINRLHLLTTTAELYFKRVEFEVTDRSKAPDSIKNTLEFSTLCPSSSIYMVKSL
jgi:amino-acid N-acetyltransferase